MAAELIAYKLKLGLYNIGLSSVVSKYMEETEKNLKKVFETAESSDSLLFDGADALFGKKTEVKDSHDRYVEYLLEIMERFKFIAVLASDFSEEINPSFFEKNAFFH
jgi:SpoVK/Ycf46/Vps4 family AAA+-type ATPase